MKRYFLIPILFLATAAFAGAQIQAPTTDTLGAHLNHGRGCAACHAPHNGAYGNGAAKTTDATSGDLELWGQDIMSLEGKTIITGQGAYGGSFSETLPTGPFAGKPQSDVFGLLMCLSCHDGNYATGAMMQNQVYESLPTTYGTHNSIPTLLGVNHGSGTASYLQDHPVGMAATIKCGGSSWDCSISSTGKVLMDGTNSLAFVNNYGYFVSPGVNASSQPVVVCTTCHNQHLMNVVSVTGINVSGVGGVALSGTGTGTSGTLTANSGLPSGFYATMFFVRAPYNPATTTAGSNQTAQFCRECHGGNSNEMNGALNIPTVF